MPELWAALSGARSCGSADPTHGLSGDDDRRREVRPPAVRARVQHLCLVHLARRHGVGISEGTVAPDAVPLYSGAGVAVEVAAAEWPGEVETSGEAKEPTGVAVGPDVSEA